MKNLCILLVFNFALCAVAASGQVPRPNKETHQKQAFAGIFEHRGRDGSFKILRRGETPGTQAGDPCEAALPIEFGQSVTGDLESTDCILDDGSYADFYTFNALAGEHATIDMASGTFDSYLGLANESGTFVVEDDDSGGGGNARIDVTLPETGTYIILANSFDPGQSGQYFLQLTGGPNCTFTFTPDSADVPAGGGTFSFGVVTQPRCYWAASTVYSEVSTQGSGLGSGTVTYTVSPNNRNQRRSFLINIRNAYFNIDQDPIACSYTFDPASISVGPDQTSGTMAVTATPGCLWSASSPSGFISASGGHLGNGTANYQIDRNNGADRTGWIVIDGHQITVTQTGANCTYSVTPTYLSVPAAGTSGNYVINTQPRCTWFLDRNQLWVEIQRGFGSGPATFPYRILPQPESSPRDAVIQLSYGINSTGQTIVTWIDQAARVRTTAADFDGDGKTDVGIFRASVGEWWYSRSSDGQVAATKFGSAEDRIAPVDFTGDGMADIAVWRPSTGSWYILRSEDNTFYGANFGTNGDIPAPGDFDGDGKADTAVFRPSTGYWFIQQSTAGFSAVRFGTNGDVPTLGDFDGDGKSDIAVFRPSNGTWYRLNSSNGSFYAAQFGQNGDTVVPADYTGDGKTDIAVYRPSVGTWYVRRSEDNSFYGQQFGAAGDLPAQGDYDGDGKADMTVFRPGSGTWFEQRSTTGFAAVQFGANGDKPAAGAFVY